MNKKLVLFGAGENGVRWLEKIGKNNVWKFVDSDINKIGTNLFGKEVISLSKLTEYKDFISIFISVSEKNLEEIKGVLKSNGMDMCIVNSPYTQDIVRTGEKIRLSIDSIFEGKNYIGNGSQIENSYIGYASYLSDDTILQNTKIGKYCAIASGVSIIRGQHPSGQFVSIHPAFYSPQNIGASICFVNEKQYEEYRYAESGYVVDIGNDVWVGKNVQLMEGIKIGDGAIIAAGAVVTKNVHPYTIVGGVPAKLIRNRFSENETDFLNKLQWWNKPDCWIQENAKYFSDIKKLQKHLQK